MQVCSCKDTSTKVTRLVPGTTYRCRVLVSKLLIDGKGQSNATMLRGLCSLASV